VCLIKEIISIYGYECFRLVAISVVLEDATLFRSPLRVNTKGVHWRSYYLLNLGFHLSGSLKRIYSCTIQCHMHFLDASPLATGTEQCESRHYNCNIFNNVFIMERMH
jgi:hypothetical protein